MNKKKFSLYLLSLVMLSGCDAFSSEPTYGGLSIEGFNYTPYNLSRFIIYDKYGNTAGGGGDLMPGSGEGSLSCCYSLKGTDFTVKWDVYDADVASRDPYAPISMIHKVSQVHVLPTKISGGAGDRILGLHFYPDDHIEFEFRNDMSGTRIFYSEVDYWLNQKYGKQANPDGENEWVTFRRTARIASIGWTKYRLTNSEDLEQYVYYTLLVNPKFDEHPAVKKIIAETKDHPGAFGAAMERLPLSTVEELKSDKFQHIQSGATHG